MRLNIMLVSNNRLLRHERQEMTNIFLLEESVIFADFVVLYV